MNTQPFLAKAGIGARVAFDSTRNAAFCASHGDDMATLFAAQARLTAAEKPGRKKRRAREPYYGTFGHLEETIDGVVNLSALDAKVTRNHYGCLVLNAGRTLFIDVDVCEPRRMYRPTRGGCARGEGPQRQVLDDLRLVLRSEDDYGFRIYRTAAGFRILATTHEFEPGSEQSNWLMSAVGADTAFVELCRLQRNFRARLSPKPWRCGSRRPPNSFPRESTEEKQRFVDWLEQYERACSKRATCEYLGHVGPEDTHARIAPVIEAHDRETKALICLPLA
jgi:hypothetical protein